MHLVQVDYENGVYNAPSIKKTLTLQHMYNIIILYCMIMFLSNICLYCHYCLCCEGGAANVNVYNNISGPFLFILQFVHVIAYSSIFLHYT